MVTASAPQEKPLATVSTIEPQTIKLLKTKNISEVLSFVPGTHVTVGAKAESHIKIRGLDNDKSTLLLDGIPVYEPYYNLYDLKTVPSEDIESIQITKGSSSILYGANTMGGIVEVLTRRPEKTSLELNSRFSQNSSFDFWEQVHTTVRNLPLNYQLFTMKLRVMITANQVLIYLSPIQITKIIFSTENFIFIPARKAKFYFRLLIMTHLMVFHRPLNITLPVTGALKIGRGRSSAWVGLFPCSKQAPSKSELIM